MEKLQNKESDPGSLKADVSGKANINTCISATGGMSAKLVGRSRKT